MIRLIPKEIKPRKPKEIEKDILRLTQELYASRKFYWEATINKRFRKNPITPSQDS